MFQWDVSENTRDLSFLQLIKGKLFTFNFWGSNFKSLLCPYSDYKPFQQQSQLGTILNLLLHTACQMAKWRLLLFILLLKD